MVQREVRVAHDEDREAVLAFCRVTWEWGDYIERVWDAWISGAEGCLFVATNDGQPVGIVHLHMLNKHEAWLEGMRVDAAYRQQGIARELNLAALAEAMRLGATIARLATEARNTASIHLSESMHMYRVGVFALYSAQAFTSASSSRRPAAQQTQLATMGDLDDIIDYLNVSNIFPSVGGLYYVGFTAYAITAELLEAKIAAKSVYLLRRWDRLDGLAIAEQREERQGKRLSVGYIDGTAIEAISFIAYDMRRLAEVGKEDVRIYAPDLVLVRDALDGIEYTWDGSIFYTYERGLV